MRKTYFAQRNEVGGIDVKFRDWFSLKAIRSEIKTISTKFCDCIIVLFCFRIILFCR